MNATSPKVAELIELMLLFGLGALQPAWLWWPTRRGSRYFGKKPWYTNAFTWEFCHLLSGCYQSNIHTTPAIWPDHPQITSSGMIITPLCFFETPWWYDDYTQLAYAVSTQDLPVISQANVGWLVPRQGTSWQCFRHACGAEPWFHQGFAWLLMFHPPFREIWWQEQQLPLSVGRPRCATASEPCGIRTPRGCGSACGRWGWGRQWKWWADVKIY